MPAEKVRTKLYFFSCNGSATVFSSLEKATEAAEEYSLDRGYLCEAFLCKCGKFHVRQSEQPRAIPEEDRWLPSRHRARRARIAEVQAASRAEEERVLAAKEELAARRALRAAAKAAERGKRRLEQHRKLSAEWYASLTEEERSARMARSVARRQSARVSKAAAATLLSPPASDARPAVG
jgi:hypothetical protein